MRCATVIAGYPTEAVQGTVRVLWAAGEEARAQAPHLIALGNLPAGRRREFWVR